ncbi:MAG TPA: hypothetical protein VJ165_05855, partial [candidate division Zixibacteria bacterium]|nr:hypothetical protein [candidate division Zixibacteria bacterium]
TYIAYSLSGFPISETWDTHGLFPLYDFVFNNWISWAIWGAGVVFMLASWLLTNTCVAKVTYEQLKGDEFYSAKEAVRFLKKNWKTVLLSPLSILLMFIFLLACGLLIGLLGKIPILGEIGFALFFGLPIFVVALFAVYVVFVLFCSIILAPAIVGTLREDSFETIVQSFSTIWNQPWRFFLYTGILGVLAKVGSFIFGYFCFRAIQLTISVCGVFMSDKLYNLIEGGLAYLPYNPSVTNYMTNLFAGLSFGFEIPAPSEGVALSWSGEIAAFILGITFVLIGFVIFSYALAIISAGQAISFVIIYKKKEGENLLQRKTDEEETEFVTETKKGKRPKLQTELAGGSE